MNAKFYFLALVTAAMAVGCVDSSYDLSDVNSDNIVIGTDESVFTVPIATIIITKGDFDDYLASSGSKELQVVTRADDSSSLSFTETIDLVNALLPSGEEVDIEKLTSDETSDEYTDYLTDILIEELQDDATKQEEFAQALIDNQDNLDDDIYTELGVSKGDDLSLEEVTSALTVTLEDPTKTESLKESISSNITENVVENLKGNMNTEVDQAVESFDLDADIIDMLTGNGRVEIIATYTHDFPFTFDLEDLKLTSISDYIQFPVTAAEIEDEDPEDIDLDKLSAILAEGAQLTSKITLKTYSSNSDGSSGSELRIKLVVKKYGGIEL